MSDSYDGTRNSVIGRQIREAKKDISRERNEIKTVKECVILDSFSGEENEDKDDVRGKASRHVWWLLRLPRQDDGVPGKVIKVRCGHSYDELQFMMGDVESQKGRKVTLYYSGYSDSDRAKGYAKAQLDYGASMPNPTAQSTVMGIGFLAGMTDKDDPLKKVGHLNYKPKNLGPRYKGEGQG